MVCVCVCVYTCAKSSYIYVCLHVCVTENKKPSATSWLGLELREFGHSAMTTCQTCTRLRERHRSLSQATNNTYAEAKSPKLNDKNQKRHSEQFPLLEKIVCVVISDIYVHKSMRTRGCSVAHNTWAAGLRCFDWFDLIYGVQTLCATQGCRDARSKFLAVKKIVTCAIL